MAYCPRFR
jgi:predicted nuclease of predicted toxin-antitoxin system